MVNQQIIGLEVAVTDAFAVHVLRRLEELAHNAAHKVFTEKLPVALILTPRHLLFTIFDKLGQALVSSELKHQVRLVHGGVFVKGHKLVKQITLQFL